MRRHRKPNGLVAETNAQKKGDEGVNDCYLDAVGEKDDGGGGGRYDGVVVKLIDQYSALFSPLQVTHSY